MTFARRRFVARLIWGLIGAHLLAIVFKTDEWPLSNYSMYSVRQQPVFTWRVLYGVTQEGSEIRLQDSKYWTPFSASKLSQSLAQAQRRDDKVQKQGGAAPPLLPAAIAGTFENYERGRASGKHAGPELRGLRLYEVTWRIDPMLANRDQPSERRLLVEHAKTR